MFLPYWIATNTKSFCDPWKKKSEASSASSFWGLMWKWKATSTEAKSEKKKLAVKLVHYEHEGLPLWKGKVKINCSHCIVSLIYKLCIDLIWNEIRRHYTFSPFTQKLSSSQFRMMKHVSSVNFNFTQDPILDVVQSWFCHLTYVVSSPSSNSTCLISHRVTPRWKDTGAVLWM